MFAQWFAKLYSNCTSKLAIAQKESIKFYRKESDHCTHLLSEYNDHLISDYQKDDANDEYCAQRAECALLEPLGHLRHASLQFAKKMR